MISVAVQNGSFVNVYNERNCLILSRPGTLVGYTSNTISIKNSNGSVQTFNENGIMISMH